MGATFSTLFNSLAFWSRNKEVRILMLGLDSAGKTTILYKLQLGEVVSTIPTIGFNVESLDYKNIKFQVWDLGGQSSIRCVACQLRHGDFDMLTYGSRHAGRTGDATMQRRVRLYTLVSTLPWGAFATPARSQLTPVFALGFSRLGRPRTTGNITGRVAGYAVRRRAQDGKAARLCQ